MEQLPKITTKSKRIMGRGHGSGRGKTAGRGTKGQKARGDIPLYFEGGALRIMKRLPLLRGKGRNKSLSRKPVTINVGALNNLPKNTVVTADSLVESKLITKEQSGKIIKILGDGELSAALTVKLPVTRGAREKIEKAGGSVE